MSGESFCPGAKIGDNSDDLGAAGLALMQDTPSGACGSANNGELVTVSWSANLPSVTGNFWIVGVNNSAGGIASGQVRWGASAPNDVTAHADTDFDAWKTGSIDKEEDFYFVVRGE